MTAYISIHCPLHTQGFDITTHTLACFGGAGPQFCCAIAQALGITSIKVHKLSVSSTYCFTVNMYTIFRLQLVFNSDLCQTRMHPAWVRTICADFLHLRCKTYAYAVSYFRMALCRVCCQLMGFHLQTLWSRSRSDILTAYIYSLLMRCTNVCFATHEQTRVVHSPSSNL